MTQVEAQRFSIIEPFAIVEEHHAFHLEFGRDGENIVEIEDELLGGPQGAEIRRRRTGPAEAEAAHRLNAAHEEAVAHWELAARFVSVRHAEPGARGEDGAPDDREIPHRVRDVLVEVVAPAQRAAGKLQRESVPRARAWVKIDVPRVAG